MNTYHFMNAPTARSDINKLIKKLEQAIADSFARQMDPGSENSVSAIENFFKPINTARPAGCLHED